MRRSIWFILAALLLSSCLGQKGASTATPNAQMVMTSVQLTVSEKLKSNTAAIPSVTIAPAFTETAVTTPGALTPSTPTLISLTLNIQTPQATQSTQTILADQAQLINQSPADQTKVNAGASFKVTWTFKNIGTSTWTTAYSAKFWSDDLMGSPATINFSKEVKPNDTIDVTMNFVAPSTIGSTKTSWWLQNANGVNFFPFFIAIQVVSAPPTAQPTTTSTIAPTQTPTITPTK